jgi:hypothetical protein
LGKLKHPLVSFVLLGKAVMLDLQEVVLSEKVLVPGHRFPGSLVVSPVEQIGHLTFQTSREGQQAVGVTRQDLLVNTRPPVKTLQIRDGGQLYQVGVTLHVSGEEDKVIGRLPVFVNFPVVTAFRSDVEFLPDDGFYPGCAGTLVEIDYPEHGPVIGDGKSWKFEIGGIPGQVRYATSPIEKTVGGVDVEMNEFGVLHKISSEFWVLSSGLCVLGSVVRSYVMYSGF